MESWKQISLVLAVHVLPLLIRNTAEAEANDFTGEVEQLWCHNEKLSHARRLGRGRDGTRTRRFRAGSLNWLSVGSGKPSALQECSRQSHNQGDQIQHWSSRGHYAFDLLSKGGGASSNVLNDGLDHDPLSDSPGCFQNDLMCWSESKTAMWNMTKMSQQTRKNIQACLCRWLVLEVSWQKQLTVSVYAKLISYK